MIDILIRLSPLIFVELFFLFSVFCFLVIKYLKDSNFPN